MSTWTLTYTTADGETSETVEADNLWVAQSGVVLPEGASFVSLCADPPPPPAALGIVASPDGTPWSVTVDDAGQVTATPVSGDTA